LLGELTAVLTAAAGRIHAEHRRRVAGWTAAASLLGLAGFPLVSKGRRGSAAALAAGIIGALARAERHRRMAELARPG
ncbi:MAG: hypothetical protein R3320_13840, partial [Nitriliruptorales bacterium]|nr:hypothetical protein [Nitriliruptorales bacterium]